eukprot:3312149-Amphidinium_carterae.1
MNQLHSSTRQLLSSCPAGKCSLRHSLAPPRPPCFHAELLHLIRGHFELALHPPLQPPSRYPVGLTVLRPLRHVPEQSADPPVIVL